MCELVQEGPPVLPSDSPNAEGGALGRGGAHRPTHRPLSEEGRVGRSPARACVCGGSVPRPHSRRDVRRPLPPLLQSHHFYTDQPEIALRFYRRLLQMGVNNTELWSNLGLCCFYASQYDMTLNCFERALALASDDNVREPKSPWRTAGNWRAVLWRAGGGWR